MNEVVLVPTYRRPEMLFYCLRLIRTYEPDIEIHIFPDRGSFNDPTIQRIATPFNTTLHLVPEHRFYGNTANVMNAYLWAFNAGYDRVFYIEDDTMVHADFFSWHREVHEECPDIFASMAWIFNRQAPITEDWLFQPWIYSIGLCFARKKLELIAPHASPLYYEDMPGYIGKHFKKTAVHNPDNVVHFEQDGLLQRILDEDKTQTVASGIAKCTHLGLAGYNRGGYNRYEEFFECEGDRVNLSTRDSEG